MTIRSVTPVFVFSLPRSGSTLLQKVLASHQEISSVSEPWILLPFIYPLKNTGVRAEYSHSLLHVAVQDLCQQLPRGEDDYLAAVRSSVADIYQKLSSPESKYFVDKTPRYHLIVEEIFRTFPDAKFIFLWRNPLAVVASIVSTWLQGNWKLYHHRVDLYDGISNLVTAYQRHSGKSLMINYENLVQNPVDEYIKIAKYLHIDPEKFDQFSTVNLTGAMGDKSQAETGSDIHVQSVSRWQKTLCNPFRKYWSIRYLNWIGPERLKVMGYDLEGLKAALAASPSGTQHLLKDLIYGTWGFFFARYSTLP